jgi:hypothetical protein
LDGNPFADMTRSVYDNARADQRIPADLDVLANHHVMSEGDIIAYRNARVYACPGPNDAAAPYDKLASAGDIVDTLSLTQTVCQLSL